MNNPNGCILVRSRMNDTVFVPSAHNYIRNEHVAGLSN